MTNIEQTTVERANSKIGIKSIIYGLIMLIGSMVYIHFNLNVNDKYAYGIHQLIIPALILIVICLVISVILDLIQKFILRRKKKTKNSNEPVWFRILESWFATWFVLIIIASIGNFLI